jgi:Secretion system C-terminal sorting domain
MKKHLFLFVLMVHNIFLIAQNFDHKVIPLPNNDMLFAPKQKRIYVSVPSSIPKYGNSICRINPNFGTIETSIWVGSEPTQLAISDDEKYLYVSFSGTPKVKRINLLTSQIEQDVFFSNNDIKSFLGYNSADISVMPGRPNTYVVAQNARSIVLDNTKQRTKILEDYYACKNVRFLTDSTIAWSWDNDGTWYKLKVDSSGISKIGTFTGMGTSQNLHYSNFDSLYYARDGYRFDLRTGTPVGRQFASAPGFSFADPFNANVYYFNQYNEGLNVKIYNRKTQIPIDQFTLPINLRGFYIAEALNWGVSGQIALRGFNEIVIFNTCTSVAPKPTISEGQSVILCSNNEVKLTASFNSPRYYWSNGDSTKTITVKKAGTYTVGMADSLGCVNNSLATDVKLILQPSTPNITISNYDETLCIGVTAKLATGYSNDPNKFEWSNGKVGQFIDVNQSSDLTVVAISPEGCRSFRSDPYPVKFLDRNRPSKPIITTIGNTPFCGNTGASVKLSATAGYKDYKWSSGQNTQDITIFPTFSQRYSLKVTDIYGCQSLSSDTTTIVIKDTPYPPSIFKNGNTLSVSYTTGIQWFLNGQPISGATKQTYTALANGFYTVQITSAEGCKSDMSNLINITTITSLNNLNEGQKFDVYPNPLQDILTLNTEGVEKSNVILIDSYGRVMWTLLLDNNLVVIPISNLASGLYTIHLKDEKGSTLSIKKIVKL